MISFNRHFAILAWMLFFLSPLAWPKTIDSYIAMDLLALAIGLIAVFHIKNFRSDFQKTTWEWLFLFALIVPIFMQLAFNDVRNPWKSWQMVLYLTCTWLIFRHAQNSSSRLIESYSWSILLAIIGTFYVIFALLQDYNLHLIPGNDIFPIWQEGPTRFGGVLIQPNLEGLFLSIVCISLWFRGLSEKKYLAWLIASVLPCAGVFATSSRSSVIALLVAAGFLIIISRQYKTGTLKLLATLALSILITSFWQATVPTGASDVNVLSRLQHDGLTSRLIIWDLSFRLFMENPWLGIGAGNLISYGTEAQAATIIHHPEWISSSGLLAGGHSWAHNYLLQFFAEWGVVGGFAVMALSLAILVRLVRLGSSRSALHSSQLQAALILAMMLLHGMVSVALLQAFFLVLFGLYAAALFPSKALEQNSTSQLSPHYKIGYGIIFASIVFIPLYVWGSFISTEIDAERSVGYPVNSPEFINPIAKGIDTPWTARPSLEMYFANLAIRHAKPSIWVNSENFAYRYWLLHQSSLSLRYRILIAHLKDDVYAEARLIEMYQSAYPDNAEAEYLQNHKMSGHAQGEKIDIWK